MALANYFLMLTIIYQTTKVALSAKEGFDGVVDQVGFGNTISFQTNPNFQNNVNSLVSDLLSESSRGFFNTSAGEDHIDRVYGFYLCRGDLSAKKCKNCLKDVRQFVLEQRLDYLEAIVYSVHLRCIVHYSNNSRSFVYRENTTFTGSRFGGDGLAPVPQYNTTLLNTMQELVTEAGYGNWTKANFATRVVEVGGTQEKIYVLVQCRPDISSKNCSNCLSDVYSFWGSSAALGSFGGKVLSKNCLLKYNNEPFFGSACRSFMPSYFHIILVMLLTVYVTL